jgi:hypothetical protein
MKLPESANPFLKNDIYLAITSDNRSNRNRRRVLTIARYVGAACLPACSVGVDHIASFIVNANHSVM